MLKKLRRRFITITMSLVTAVLLVVFVFMCVTQNRIFKENIETALNQAMSLKLGFEIRPLITADVLNNVATVFVRTGNVDNSVTDVSVATSTGASGRLYPGVRLITGAKLGESANRVFFVNEDGAWLEIMADDALRPVEENEFGDIELSDVASEYDVEFTISTGSEPKDERHDPSAGGEEADAAPGMVIAALPHGAAYEATWASATRPAAVTSGMLEKYRSAALIPTFWVSVSAGGDIISSRNNVSISDEELGKVVRYVLDAEEDTGNIGEYSLRYMKRAEPSGDIRIAYADRTAEITGMRNVIINSLLVGIPALAALFLISLFLSSRALRPVSDAWNRQRRFVSDASHELKTPLTVILANMGLMLSHTEDRISDHIQLAENTRIEAGRMKNLVEDLLMLAAADTRPEAARSEAVSLSDLAWNAVLSFEPVAFEQGVQINGDIAQNVETMTDRSAATQIITILLDNAVKYAGEGGVVDVILRGSAGAAELIVSNTGEGIAPEHLPHIFERFYRADQSRSEGGFGLGLAIAAELAELNGYKIDASSDGEGAIFTVRF